MPLPPSRHPYQVWAMAACAGGGINSVASPDAGAIDTVLELWALLVWATLLLTVGVLSLCGAWWKDRVTGLLMERISHGGLCGGAIIYGFIVIAATTDITFGALLTIGIGIAAGWRFKHVNRELETLRRWMEREYGDG